MQIKYFLGLIPFVFLISTAVAAPVNNLQARGSLNVVDGNIGNNLDFSDILKLKDSGNLQDTLNLVDASIS
jgi:hypothetical protein